MEHLRFENIVRDLEVDDEVRLREVQRVPPANRCYVILFSARSGSTWLTSVLSATKRLGRPEEYINPDFILDVARATNSKRPEDLFESLKRRRKSDNLVFGMETRHVDVDLIGFDAFRRSFGPETIYFHLWRENIVAQGISLYRAIQTEHFHSNSAGEKAEPAYDPDGMLRWVRHIANTENGNVRLLQRLGAPARHLIYEQMVASRQQTIEQVAHALAVPFEPNEFAAPADGELRKLGDSWNDEAEARLRADKPAEVAAFEGARLVKLGVPAGLHPLAPGDPEAREAWQRGKRSGIHGRSPLNNPFAHGSALARHWWMGWRRGWDNQLYIRTTA